MPELVWDFREECDEYDGWPVFYQIAAENVPLYRDHGLTLLKLGDEARLWLPDYPESGPLDASLQDSCRQAAAAGCEFRVVGHEEVPALLGELRAVSDAWLAARGRPEQGFSRGRFATDYLRRFPSPSSAAAGRSSRLRTSGRPPAGPSCRSICCGTGPTAPAGLRDYLFTEIIRWGRSAGYIWFNLGLAPLAGAAECPLASPAGRDAGLVFHHVEHFSAGWELREYLERFRPTWSPKYLAFQSRRSLPHVLADVAQLIRGRGQAPVPADRGTG